MKIKKIKINNYRLLKIFSIDLEDELSLIVGKNNCAKTSFLVLLESFLSSHHNRFSFDDFNILYQKEIKIDIDKSEIPENYYFGIKMRLYINYDENDNLKNISSVMLNLDPEDNIVVLSFEYSIGGEEFSKIKRDFKVFSEKNHRKKKDILFFLKKNHRKYFKVRTKALEYNNEDNFIEIDEKERKKILMFKKIDAKRDVSDADGTKKGTYKTLSRMSSQYYDGISNTEIENVNARDLQTQLSEADEKFNAVYEKLFTDVVEKVKNFGGIRKNESIIKIVSTLEEKNILKENTSVMYEQEDYSLPEDYNGLGYLNLISMIFKILINLNGFRVKKNNIEEPADINLFFIEEPEAHTHPQMQYVFIKNIKDLLKEESKEKANKCNINLQTIISTHSSHIAAESNFNDIKYFYREDANSVISKNFSSLEAIYRNNNDKGKQFRFVKRYLTINLAELFFTDKAILIEGDTERIILPAIMKKIDYERKGSKELPLLSQNISIIQTGDYSKIFEKLIDFLKVKTLIITDLDSVYYNRKKSSVKNGEKSCNPTINFFFNKLTLEKIIELDFKKKVLKREGEQWIPDQNATLCVAYQTKEKNYHARSFEDAFISINMEFIEKNIDNFLGLKNKYNFKKKENNDDYYFDIVENCIKKKTQFALDILYNSKKDFSNWKIPAYIKEGLIWLRKN